MVYKRLFVSITYCLLFTCSSFGEYMCEVFVKLREVIGDIKIVKILYIDISPKTQSCDRHFFILFFLTRYNSRTNRDITTKSYKTFLQIFYNFSLY